MSVVSELDSNSDHPKWKHLNCCFWNHLHLKWRNLNKQYHCQIGTFLRSEKMPNSESLSGVFSISVWDKPWLWLWLPVWVGPCIPITLDETSYTGAVAIPKESTCFPPHGSMILCNIFNWVGRCLRVLFDSSHPIYNLIRVMIAPQSDSSKAAHIMVFRFMRFMCYLPLLCKVLASEMKGGIWASCSPMSPIHKWMSEAILCDILCACIIKFSIVKI